MGKQAERRRKNSRKLEKEYKFDQEIVIGLRTPQPPHQHITLVGQDQDFSRLPFTRTARNAHDLNRSQFPISRSLCDICQCIFQTDCDVADLGKPTYAHYESESELQTAKNLGCYICTLLWQEINEQQASLKTNSVNDSDKVLLPRRLCYRLETQDWGNEYLTFGYEDKESTVIGWKQVLKLELLRASDIEPTLSKTPLSSNTEQKACLDVARNWLSQCRSGKHWNCKKVCPDAYQVPTRLVNCGELASGDWPRLCERGDLPHDAEYVTLSHCWGKYPIFSLSTKNIEILKYGLPLDLLPKTFLDAIFVTRELGFKYVWIDSLCIVQDCDEDWRREAEQMGTYYQNAILNIAATSVSDGRMGFFRARDPNFLLPYKVFANWDGPWPYLNTPRKGHYYLCNTIWDNEINGSPLNRRCWVVQERILSPRVLHFGTTQIFWECTSMTANEVFAAGFHASMNVPPAKNSIPVNRERRTPLRNEHFYALWANIVQIYSRGGLTRTSDKLIAISGIAARVQTLLQDVYLAGLWKKSLPRQLLWKVSPGCEITGLPLESRAPSWSWASLDAPVDFFDATRNIERDDHEVLHASLAETQTILSIPTGPMQVAEGYIRLKGPLKRASVSTGHFVTTFRQWVIDSTVVELDFYPDMSETWQGPTKKEGWCSLVQESPGELYVRIGDSLNLYSDVYLMPIRSDEDVVYGTLCLHGLILSPTYRARGEFFRLGKFTAEEASDHKTILGSSRGLDELMYEVFDGLREYTIKIV
ncbi:heterokaryon incompatibility protein-domain-containing protein [Paraphoma chrysanthemicola]|uniref:Heterokaryon incompatibility protein-domain-containing protein n=1 Tax=Paraphoma chrysanthemicola TaxID=798071 RepID=A0A8K0R3K6_9PLEO|nr:heterokaryon incompatibility protein-domain-containing protein [Paraphoma chrysanthemicola]